MGESQPNKNQANVPWRSVLLILLVGLTAFVGLYVYSLKIIREIYADVSLRNNGSASLQAANPGETVQSNASDSAAIMPVETSEIVMENQLSTGVGSTPSILPHSQSLLVPVPVTASAKIQVWQAGSVPPELYPPASLTEKDWLDAMLTDTGGVVVLKKGDVITWHQSAPGQEQRLELFDAVYMLQASPQQVVALGRSGLWLMSSNPGEAPTQITEGFWSRLYPSQMPGFIVALDVKDQLFLIHLDGKKAPRKLPTLPGTRALEAVLNSQGLLWLTSQDRRLWRYDTRDSAPYQLMPHAGVELVTSTATADYGWRTSEVISLNDGSSFISFPRAKALMSAGNFSLIHNSLGQAIFWNSKEPPVTLQLAAHASQVRLSPRGLIVSW